MSEEKLQFKLAKNKKDFQKVYEYNLSVFLDEDEFPWSLKWLEEQHKNGYDIYLVEYGGEVMAALFVKVLQRGLFSMQTPLKLNFQGMGLSHQIKEYAEVLARQANLRDIYNYCAIENFRMMALNESHGYERTGRELPEKNLIEWHKRFL